MENYSLSDLRSAVGGDGLGGNSAWVLILLFFFAFGGNGFGFGRNNDVATATGMSFDSLSKQVNQIGDGISSLGYSQLQQMDNNTASINGNIVNEGRAIQTQLAECCCSNKEQIAQVRYDMANFNNATLSAIHSEGEATRNLIQQNQMEALKGRINQLELSQAVSGVVRYPSATTYTSGANPFCGCSCANV